MIKFLNLEKTEKCLNALEETVAPIIAKGLSGATTVATTMMFAHMAGIKVLLQEVLVEYTLVVKTLLISQLTLKN